MTFQTVTRQPATQRPAGFTLIELMIVILIIAILVGLIVPTTIAVLHSARVASAKSEMAGIETGIATFKSEFGKIPPSFISFVPTAAGALPSPTKATLRSMFPQISFSLTSDSDGDGTRDLVDDLTAAGLWGNEVYGPEALVLFLGGVRKDTDGDGAITSADRVELTGFSKNPARPFMQPSSASSTRLGPFTEFDTARLVDTGGATDVLEYLDKLPDQDEPLIYVSTAATGSYRASDAGLPDYDLPNDTPDAGPIPWTPYQKSAGSFYNPTSYQLISPGSIDLGNGSKYGKGGVFNVDENVPAIADDADNLTNFYSGELGG